MNPGKDQTRVCIYIYIYTIGSEAIKTKVF